MRRKAQVSATELQCSSPTPGLPERGPCFVGSRERETPGNGDPLGVRRGPGARNDRLGLATKAGREAPSTDGGAELSRAPTRARTDAACQAPACGLLRRAARPLGGARAASPSSPEFSRASPSASRRDRVPAHEDHARLGEKESARAYSTPSELCHVKAARGARGAEQADDSHLDPEASPPLPGAAEAAPSRMLSARRVRHCSSSCRPRPVAMETQREGSRAGHAPEAHCACVSGT